MSPPAQGLRRSRLAPVLIANPAWNNESTYCGVAESAEGAPLSPRRGQQNLHLCTVLYCSIAQLLHTITVSIPSPGKGLDVSRPSVHHPSPGGRTDSSRRPLCGGSRRVPRSITLGIARTHGRSLQWYCGTRPVDPTTVQSTRIYTMSPVPTLSSARNALQITY